MVYRGFEINPVRAEDPRSTWEWVDELGRVHNGKVDLSAGFANPEACMSDIDRYKREQRGK